MPSERRSRVAKCVCVVGARSFCGERCCSSIHRPGLTDIKQCRSVCLAVEWLSIDNHRGPGRVLGPFRVVLRYVSMLQIDNVCLFPGDSNHILADRKLLRFRM